MEHAIAKVERDYRVFIPRSLLAGVGWPKDDPESGAHLLVGGQGRCRLLSRQEVRGDPICQRLRERVAADLAEPVAGPTSFRDDAVSVMDLRLLSVDLIPHSSGYRLTLPKLLAGILRVQPGEDHVALLACEGHLEIWALEALREAVNVRLEELL